MKKLVLFISLAAGTIFFAVSAAFTAPVGLDPAGASGVFWKEDFQVISQKGPDLLPEGWVIRGKPGTQLAKFTVIKDDKGGKAYLHMEADKASATLLTQIGDVDLLKNPILKWRWRIRVLPDGADGRVKSKDDQAIGIYVGTGGIVSNKSISYRWDTLTPKGSEGVVSYAGGAVKVKWITLRNNGDQLKGAWVVEERNVAEDFKEAWGFYPDKVYVSVSCNSQYTGSTASADLDWIELGNSEGMTELASVPDAR